MRTRRESAWAAADAGAREHFLDAALYDYEYRHRRADIRFYRQLVRNRMEFVPGPVLDLACGTGRLLIPLARDGHAVIGIDRSWPMLAAAARRRARLSPLRRQRCALVAADLRAFAIGGHATIAICAFHSVQHLYAEEDFLRFLACTRANLCRGGWLAFDVLPPDPRWLARDPGRRWAVTRFRHPGTGQRFVYSSNHAYDPATRLLHMRLYYQPIDEQGLPAGRERTVRLCHRQYDPAEVGGLLARGGFRLVETFAGFDGQPLAATGLPADEHVYVAVAA